MKRFAHYYSPAVFLALVLALNPGEATAQGQGGITNRVTALEEGLSVEAQVRG
jgi:hypothetical protein